MRCEECGAVAEGRARGWEAHRVDDVIDFEEDRAVLFFCPSCVQREFAWEPDEDEA